MAFGDIKGQDRAIEFFRSSINRGRLSHAYLFAGAEGLGKTLLAKNVAKLLNCENPVKEGERLIDCCQRCISCHKIDGFNHPDVHWIEGEGKSGKISIDEIRLLQKDISLKPYEGKFKVFIIQQAHQMSEEAANCLLKTLEEPPAFSLIILTSSNINGLLPTIISRCQIIKFSHFEGEVLKKILVEDYKIEDKEAHFLSVASEGRIGQALRLRDEAVLDKKNRLIDGVCQSKREVSASETFNIKDRKELLSEIGHFLNWFRDILVFKSGLPASSIINADRMERIKSRANLYSFQELEQVITKIIGAYRLIEQNVNPKIALEVMLTEIAKCRK